jgi:hypothetical protein
MKIRISLFLLALFFDFVSFGQNALDLKNGFKDFTFGDPISKWNSSITFLNKSSDGVSVYKYIGSCCQQVFNYDLSEIRLGFLNNKLDVIMLMTKKFQKGMNGENKPTRWNGTQDLEKIKANFEDLFGKASSPSIDEKTGKIHYYWTSQKVGLVLSYEYLGINDGDFCIILVKTLNKNSNPGF